MALLGATSSTWSFQLLRLPQKPSGGLYCQATLIPTNGNILAGDASYPEPSGMPGDNTRAFRPWNPELYSVVFPTSPVYRTY